MYKAGWMLKMLVMVTVGVAAMSWVVMSLWNWIAPEVFAGAGQVTYPQAIGMLVLSKILFGFRGRGGHCRYRRFENLSEEDREKLKERMSHCGWKSQKQEATEGPAQSQP